MLLNLTDLSDEPLQGQIARQIRAKVLTGDLAADDGLPSIRALARDHRISVITVQRAYEAVEREGLIHSRRGKGFFVSELTEEKKKAMAIERLVDRIKPHVDAAIAEGLSVDDINMTIKKLLKD